MEPSDDSFIRRVLYSGFWASSLTVVNRLLQLGKIAILANLLSPTDFGIIGIALLSINALRQVSKTGFDEALIQHKEQNVNPFFDTVFIVKIVRGIVIASVLYLSAPYIAKFFGEPRVLPILRVLGILVVMEGFTNP
jgi:O-antigen/teichoic acid export membrane protein